jgi:hypothetical protein
MLCIGVGFGSLPLGAIIRLLPTWGEEAVAEKSFFKK